MQYIISFLEGIITFISPCLLPMIPIYLTYFAGSGERTTKKTVTGALGFVSGFTLVFVTMGALAGSIGSLFTKHQTIVNIVCGLIVIFFGHMKPPVCSKEQVLLHTGSQKQKRVRFRTRKIRYFPKIIDIKSESFGIVVINIDGENIEIATFRKDRECDGRHADVVYADPIIEDAERRDFTINALYEDKYGNIYDPTGLGENDIQYGFIRFIGSMYDRCKEDNLR